MTFEVGQEVISYKIGSVGQFRGKVVSIGEGWKNTKFAAVVDPLGRAFHRSFNEIRPVEPEDD